MGVQIRADAVRIYIITSHVLGQHKWERAGLANSKLTIDSLLECS